MQPTCPFCGAKIRVFYQNHNAIYFCGTEKRIKVVIVKWVRSEKCKKSPVLVPASS